jgi:hypothetical protein
MSLTSSKIISSYRYIVALLVSVAVSLGYALFAQDPTSGMKDFDNRREGTTIRQDALEDFTVLSVDRYVEPYKNNATLYVRFYFPSGLPAASAFVEALELQDSFHYFMQAKQVQWKTGDWNVFGPWPTSAVIDPLDIHSDNLSVRAGVQLADKSRFYFPVDVYQKQAPPRKQSYTFHFVTGQDLQSLDISIVSDKGASVNLKVPILSCDRKMSVNCILYPAGTTQAFDLDMSQLPEGEYRIHGVGHMPKTSDETSLNIRLYHHPG